MRAVAAGIFEPSGGTLYYPLCSDSNFAIDITETHAPICMSDTGPNRLDHDILGSPCRAVVMVSPLWRASHGFVPGLRQLAGAKMAKAIDRGLP